MKKLFLYLFTVLILVIVWPIFAEWVPMLAKPWRWYPLGVLISVIYAKDYLTTKQFGWLVVYSSVVCINAIVGDSYVDTPMLGLIQFLGFYCISSAPILLLNEDSRGCCKLYFYVFITLLIFTTIMSLIFNSQFPDVVRNDMRRAGLEDTYHYSHLYKYGLTYYQFAHAMPILIPAFLSVFKNRNNQMYKRFVYLGLAVLCILHTYVSGATTPFLLAIVVFVSSLIVTPGLLKNNTKTVLALGVTMLPVLFDGIQLLIVQCLDMIAGGEGAVHEHLSGLEHAILLDSSYEDLQSRKDLYALSLHSFFNSPIWGVNSEVGGHSVFLDNLGAFGVIGFIPLFFYLTNTVKVVLQYIEDRFVIHYYLSVFAMFFLMSTKAVTVWTLSCFCFLTVPIIMKVSNKA